MSVSCNKEGGINMFTKIPSHIWSNVMRESESALKAFAKVTLSDIYKIILIVNEDEKLIGVISHGDTIYLPGKTSNLWRALIDDLDVTVGDVCTKNFSYLTDKDDKYLCGTRLFVEKTFNEIPILDENGVPVEIFGRFQAFFQEYTVRAKHIRPHYAKCIGAAAELASMKGYDRITVIEFGVAAGDGLRLAEIYAEEAGRLLGLSIDVYGFDSGNGLPEARDYRDLPNIFSSGDFKTDIEKVKSKLRNAKMIVGDICDTSGDFLNGNIAPIGAMLIDVDLYTPTVAILNMLREDDKYFLPQVFMYFDDIANNWEFQGEALAIKEFNAKSENVKIAPEATQCTNFWAIVTSGSIFYNFKPDIVLNDWYMSRMKVCMRFSHPKF